jgi:hypothetical protein
MPRRNRLPVGRAAQSQRGVALLAVLWLSVALTLVAMTTAYVVRTEAGAVGNHLDAERAAWLARGALQAGIYAVLHPAGEPAGSDTSMAQQLHPRQRWLRYEFVTGQAVVEVVPENAKLNVNQASAEQLAALFALLGRSELESRQLAEAIMDWRTPRASSVATPMDMFYAALPQPYEPRHAPLEELEELLAIKGMDRDLFFGQLLEDAAGNRRRTPPLGELLTVEPSFGGVNVYYAAYEVLRVLPAWDESLAREVIQARSRLASGTLMDAVPRLARLTGVSPIAAAAGSGYTLTATAQLHDSGVRRSVRVRLRVDRAAPMGFQITGWWEDWPWSAPPAQQSSPNGGAR